MATVYEASGVVRACSHRFRPTLATEVLELGGTFEGTTDILGDSETIVRKQDAMWSAGRQSRISGLLRRLWHAYGTRNRSDLQPVKNEWGRIGGRRGDRTPNLCIANAALSQLS